MEDGLGVMWSVWSLCRICPIFQVSNVTGTNLDLLRAFLNLLSGRMHCYGDKPPEFQIDETYSVPVSVHLVSFQSCTGQTWGPVCTSCVLECWQGSYVLEYW